MRVTWIRKNATAMETMALLALVIPLMVGSLAEMLLGAADTAIVGRLGDRSLAAVGVGSSIFGLLVQVLGAAAIGYQITAARRFGAGDKEGVCRSLHLAAGVLLGIAAVFTIGLLLFADPLVAQFTTDPEVRRLAVRWICCRSVGMLIFTLTVLLRMTLDVAGRTVWGMWEAWLTNGANVALSIILVYGFGRVHGLGLEGSALGSVLAEVIGLIFIAVLLRSARILPTRGRFHPTWQEGKAFLRLSLPEMLNMSVDYAATLLVFVLLGLFGTQSLAAGRVTFVLMVLIFGIAMNFGIGIQIRIAQAAGREDYAAMGQHLAIGRLVAMIGLGLPGLLLMIWPDRVMHLFTPSHALGDRARYALFLVGLSAPLMAWTTASVGALRAQKQTLTVMWSNIVTVWLVQMPVSYYCGVKMGGGLAGVFAGYVAYFAARAILTQFLASRYMAKERTIRMEESHSQEGHGQEAPCQAG